MAELKQQGNELAWDTPAGMARGGAAPQLSGWLARLRRFDAQRPSVPGEHWFAAGTGLLLCRRARHAPNAAGRLLYAAAGMLMVARSLSGRDGLLARLRRR